ncbi:MAG: hypothetical protein EHM23_05305, partial [Acidobacteria bacterium]
MTDRSGPTATAFRRIDFLMLVLLILTAGSFSSLYVASEHAFYPYDWSHFELMAAAKARGFLDNPLRESYRVWRSTFAEYNQLYALPLLPFFWVSGGTRMGFILGLVLVYLVPFCLVMGAVATRLFSASPRPTFWLTAWITLLTPPVFASAMRGYPDLGSALLVGLAVYLFLGDTRLRIRGHIFQLALLLALATLLRRSYVFATAAFFGSMAGLHLWAFLNESGHDIRRGWQTLSAAGIRIGAVVLVFLLLMATLGVGFASNLLANDYGALWESWTIPRSHTLWYYATEYGWLTWLLATLGLTLALASATPTCIHNVRFILLSAVLSLFIWVVCLRTVGVHHSLHLAAPIVLGLSALFWTGGARRGVRALVATVSTGFLVVNFLVAVTPVEMLKGSRGLLAADYSPLVRSSYKELERLVTYLREKAANQPIFVESRSIGLNANIIKYADRVIPSARSPLNILNSPVTDSRDRYPLEPLLEAQWAVTTEGNGALFFEQPQRVAEVIHVAFRDRWEIARDFERHPVCFRLTDDYLEVHRGQFRQDRLELTAVAPRSIVVYERVRPTSPLAAIRTLEAIRSYVRIKPGRQLDWIVLDQGGSTQISRIDSNVYQFHFAHASEASPPASLLYLGKLPRKAKVTGTFSSATKMAIVLEAASIEPNGQALIPLA